MDSSIFLSSFLPQTKAENINLSGSTLHKSGMTDCEYYAIGSFFVGVLAVLLAFIVLAIVLRLLNCKMVIQKRNHGNSPSTSARINTDNAERNVEVGNGATVAPGCGEDTPTEAAATSLVASTSGIVTPVGAMDDPLTRTLSVKLSSIVEEDVTGTTIASNTQTFSTDRPMQEGLMDKQHHQCPSCRCATVMRRRSTSNRLSLGETARISKPSGDWGIVRQPTESSSSASSWTDESFQCENRNGEYTLDSLQSNPRRTQAPPGECVMGELNETQQPPGGLLGYGDVTTEDRPNGSEPYRTLAPSGELRGNTPSTSQTPSGEWSGVDMHRKPVSSVQIAIRICKRESLMPPCDT